MKFQRYLWLASSVLVGVNAHSQLVPPADHIVISDPRIFDLSDGGAVYQLNDGPVSSGTLTLVQGPKGVIAGTATVTDQFLNTWGPVDVSGKLSVKGTLPLNMKISGSTGGRRLTITGTYNPQVTLMNVVVNLSTVKNPVTVFQWNDAFVPVQAANVGVALDRTDVFKNAKGTIRGTHDLLVPGNPIKVATTTDRQTPGSGFQFKTSGIKFGGSYNMLGDVFSIPAVKMNVGYGSIISPGALVSITSDNFFPRNL